MIHLAIPHALPAASPTVASRRARFASLLGAAATLLTLAPSARADLVSPFLERIDVDPLYVTGATSATDIAWTADGRAVVTTRSGTVVVRLANGTKVSRANVFAGVDGQTIEQGLLGVVADPNVATNFAFYFYVSNGMSAGDKHRVFKGVLNTDNTLTIDTATPIIAAMRMNGPGLEGPANHNGGGLVIHQNHLFIGVGDTGANSTPPTNKFGSCLNRPNGKILRVALDGSIPTDNPLYNTAQVTACDANGRSGGAWTSAPPDRRIFAWGFRNPWRFWIDPQTNRLWIGDVGETTREEISTGTGNAHYGWPFNEGNMNYGAIGGKDCSTAFEPARPCTAPVHDYDNNSVGTCVIGGLIPSGCGWSTALGGTPLYLFADNGRGWIRALTVNQDRTGVTTPSAIDFGSFTGGPSSIRMGPDESLYVVFNGGNAVYRFTPRDRTGCLGGMGGMGGMGGAGAGGVATAGGGMGGMSGVGTGGLGPGGTGVAGSVGAAGANGPGGASGGGAGSAGSANGGVPGAGTGPGGFGATAGQNGRDPVATDSSCGCRAVRKGKGGSLTLVAAALLVLGLRRTRRRASS